MMLKRKEAETARMKAPEVYSRILPNLFLEIRVRRFCRAALGLSNLTGRRFRFAVA
tara:strand:- start:503 stop:670 length:168 start_codon:yes stop_codon:yes gene_type:complete